jgi:pimeloyl-ACP methyl ester carboxylesterase
MPGDEDGPQTVESSEGVGVVVHHLASGPRHEPLLIAHATGFHGRAYRPLAAALDQRFDTWGLDSRGHGSTRPPDRWTVDWQRYGDDAEAAAIWLVKRSGAGSGALVGFGHSMGGATLLMTAERNPRLFRALVLFEPIVFPPAADYDPESSPLVVGARRRRRRFESVDAAITHYSAKPPLDRFVAEALEEYVRGGFAPAEPNDPDGAVELTCSPELESATFASSQEARVWETLTGIATPVLVVGGRPDPNNPPSLMAEPIATQLARGRYHAEPELDHFGPFVNPVAVARIVVSFISRIAPSGGSKTL